MCVCSACVPFPLHLPLAEDEAGVSSGQQGVGVPEVSAPRMFLHSRLLINSAKSHTSYTSVHTLLYLSIEWDGVCARTLTDWSFLLCSDFQVRTLNSSSLTFFCYTVFKLCVDLKGSNVTFQNV